MVVELKTPLDNQVDVVWVKWYGDNKFSKVREKSLFQLNDHFETTYSQITFC